MTGATGLRLFVVCLRHTTKPLLHSAKGLPMATHKKADSATKKSRQRALCRVLFVEHMVKVSVFRWAHNKVFAICQKTLGKHRYRYKKNIGRGPTGQLPPRPVLIIKLQVAQAWQGMSELAAMLDWRIEEKSYSQRLSCQSDMYCFSHKCMPCL